MVPVYIWSDGYMPVKGQFYTSFTRARLEHPSAPFGCQHIDQEIWWHNPIQVLLGQSPALKALGCRPGSRHFTINEARCGGARKIPPMGGLSGEVTQVTGRITALSYLVQTKLGLVPERAHRAHTNASPGPVRGVPQGRTFYCGGAWTPKWIQSMEILNQVLAHAGFWGDPAAHSITNSQAWPARHIPDSWMSSTWGTQSPRVVHRQQWVCQTKYGITTWMEYASNRTRTSPGCTRYIPSTGPSHHHPWGMGVLTPRKVSTLSRLYRRGVGLMSSRSPITTTIPTVWPLRTIHWG